MSASNSRVQKNLKRRSPVPKPIPKSKSFVESMAMEMLLSTRTSLPVTNQASTIAPMIYQASSNIDEERSLRSSRSAASGSSFSSNGSLVDQLQDSITEPELLPAPVIPAKAPKPVSVFSISDFMKNVAPAAAPFDAQHRPSDLSNTSKDLLTTVEDTNEDATVEEPVEENPDEDSWVTDSSGLPPMGSEQSEHSVHSVHSDHLARSEHSDLEHSIFSEMPHDGTFPAGNEEYYGEQAEANDSYEDAGADEGQQLVQENDQVYSEESDESDESEENTDGNSLEDQLARYISDEFFVQELLDNQEAVDVGDSSQSNSMDVRSTADNVVDDMLHTATLTSALDNPSLPTTTTTTATTATTTTTTIVAADSTVHYSTDHTSTSINLTSFASYDSTDADDIDPMLVLLNRSESSEFRVENPMRTLTSKRISVAKQAPIAVPVDVVEEQVGPDVLPDALLDVLVNVCEPSLPAVSMLAQPVPEYVVNASIAPEQEATIQLAADYCITTSTSLMQSAQPDLVVEVVPALVPSLVPLGADSICRSRSESPPPPPPPPPLPSMASHPIPTHTISTDNDRTDHNIVEDPSFRVNITTVPFPVLPLPPLPGLPSQLLPAQLHCDDNDVESSDSTPSNSNEQLQYVNIYLPTTSTISADEDPHTSSVMNTVDVNTTTITTATNSTSNSTTTPTTSTTTNTTTLTPTSSRARGRHLSPGKVRGSILAATATPTMSVPVADSGRVDRYRNKSAISGTASSSVSGRFRSGGGSGGSGGASEGLLSGGSNSKINAGGDVTVKSVSTVMTSPTTNIITPSEVEGLNTLHTAAHAAAAVDASALNAAKHTSLSLYQELDLLVQYKSSLLLQTQLVDKIIELKRALAGDGSQDPQHQLRLQLSIDITSDMLQRSVAESALISSALLGTTGDTNIPSTFDLVVDEGDVQTATAATPARTPSRGGVCRTHSLASAGVSNGSAVNTPARPLTNTYSHGPHAFPLRSHTSSTSTSTSTTTTPNATRTRLPSPLTNTLNTASTSGAGTGARADSIRRNSLGNIIPSPLRRASSVNRPALRTPVTKTSTNTTANGAGNVEVVTTPTHEPNVSAIHSAATNTNNTMRSIELFPTSPMDTFRRNAAMVNSMLGNIDNYCTCCRTKLVDMDAQKNTRMKHSACKTCIHRK